ncbi:hypothetical protein RF11_08233 [Thelohanellus kitauei]|uniref:Serpin domain-containing protein n=1 Tax=Thelohanellus kitauei TaxID=669202 RepID=A0A0C2M3T8_THEKT|nr:hypothetical protein RF11_08233 [Thelohanellus kitauei]
MGSVSFSGLIVYVTLSLINFGLRNPEKAKLLYLLNCNNSSPTLAHFHYVIQLSCISSFALREFGEIGGMKSAIFHSSPPVENFQQMALENYDIHFENINAVNYASQHATIKEWSKSVQENDFFDILNNPLETELSILPIDDLYIRFNWIMPLKTRYTEKRNFTDNLGNQFEVNMMRMVNLLKYYHDTELKASIVSIQLQNTSFRSCGCFT